MSAYRIIYHTVCVCSLPYLLLGFCHIVLSQIVAVKDFASVPVSSSFIPHFLKVILDLFFFLHKSLLEEKEGFRICNIAAKFLL